MYMYEYVYAYVAGKSKGLSIEAFPCPRFSTYATLSTELNRSLSRRYETMGTVGIFVPRKSV